MGKGTSFGAFDKLVSGLNADERKILLEKLSAISSAHSVPEFELSSEKKEEKDGSDLSIAVRLKRESIFYYLILCIRAIFTHNKVEKIYNDDLIASLARKISSRTSHVLDYQHKILCQAFYNYLLEIKECADFFRPYVSIVKDYPGEFYVFLSAYIAPEISAEIKKDVDPYSIPFDRELTSETRMAKIRSLETILRAISPDSRAKLYDAAKRVEWLGQFAVFPYMHFIAQFTAVSSSSYTCPFDNAKDDFPGFARVFSTAASVPTETLQAMFLFYHKKNTLMFSSKITAEQELLDFVENSSEKFSKIKEFVSAVPMDKLGKVIFHSYDWQCEKFGGAEDWFQKFHDEWKHIFDEQWDSWLRDRKKSKLVVSLKNQFGIDVFPDLPYKPWADIWDGIQFNGELTGGFLVWFFVAKIPSVMPLLNVLLLEGIFINNENRAELADVLDSLQSISSRLNQFVLATSSKGDYGSAFEELKNTASHTMQAQSSIDSIMVAAESQIHELNKMFCNDCRSLGRILSGILDEDKRSGYSGLQNFASIKGNENAAYRKKLSDTKILMADALALLAEIEPLDLPRYGFRSK